MKRKNSNKIRIERNKKTKKDEVQKQKQKFRKLMVDRQRLKRKSSEKYIDGKERSDISRKDTQTETETQI